MARSNGVRKMFDHNGLATPPCGTPVVVGCHFPASITPASRKLRIKCRTRPSLISAAISLTSLSWSISSKKATDVGIQDPEVAFVDLLPHLPHRHVGRTPRPIPERAVGKVGFEDGSHLLNQRLLNHPIRNRGDSELSEPSVRLRDTDPLHRRGSVAPVAQLPVQRGQALLLPVGEGGDAEAVDAGPALIVSDVSPGFGQVSRSIDLVDQ